MHVDISLFQVIATDAQLLDRSDCLPNVATIVVASKGLHVYHLRLFVPRYEGAATSHPVRLQGALSFDARTFWRWTAFGDYVQAVLTISAFLGVAT